MASEDSSIDDDWETAADRPFSLPTKDVEQDLTILERQNRKAALKEKGITLQQKEAVQKDAQEKIRLESEMAANKEGARKEQEFQQRIKEWKRHREMPWICKKCELSNHKDCARCSRCNDKKPSIRRPTKWDVDKATNRLAKNYAASRQEVFPSKKSCKHGCNWKCVDGGHVHNKGKGKYQKYQCTECGKKQNRSK